MRSPVLPAQLPTHVRLESRPVALALGAALALATTLGAQTQEPLYVHESWTAKDGLPVNSITGLLQDRVGYIWIATFDGLVRFDGVRFTVFNSSTSDELPSNRILQLEEAGDGALWVVTAQGHVVRFRDGRFTNLPFEGAAPVESPSNLLIDSTGTVWIGRPDGLWRARGDRLFPVARGALDGRVLWLTQRRDGSLWAGTDSAGVFRLTSDTSAVRFADGGALDDDRVVSMFEDSRGTLWVATDKALWALRQRAREVKAASGALVVKTIVEVPATRSVIVEARSGFFRVDSGAPVPISRAIPTMGPGVELWTDERLVWTIDGQDVRRDGRLVFTVPNQQLVSHALFDREGSLWLGTATGGLHFLKRALFTTYRSPHEPAPSNVYPTYVDRSGAVWYSTSGVSGAKRIDPATGKIELFWSTTPPFVGPIFQDTAGRYWIGSATGVFVCQLATVACRAEGPAELRERGVFALFGDSSGGLWVGSASRLFRYDGHSWTTFRPSSGVPDANIRAFAGTRDGTLWMGTNGGGVARYRAGRFTRLTRQEGLPSDLIRSLHVDRDGWLWVGTEGRGLVRLDPRALGAGGQVPRSAIIRIATADGLYDDVIHQILEDDAGRLWMNTNRGVFWVLRAELNAFAEGRVRSVHSTGYTERDGLLNREGNGGVQPAGAKTPDGRLWFPTQDGVVVVDPARVGEGRAAPPVIVEQVIANEKPLALDSGRVTVAVGQRDVRIDYTALTFLEPGNVRFRYRLEGYDANWVDAGSRRTAFYTKLTPGTHRFRVNAADGVGNWSEPGASIEMHVLPRFHETTSFRLAMAAALAVILIGGVRLRVAQLHARSRALERTVAERTATVRERERQLAEQNARLEAQAVELTSLDRAKTRFFANVSHELRTPLTLIIGPLDDLRAAAGGDHKVQRWADIASSSARRLLRLVNQILDVAKLDAKQMRLTRQALDLVGFARGIVAAFAPVAERKGIRMTVEAPDALVGAFDADAIEKVLTNLLSNAIKFTPNDGIVELALARDGASATVVVRDSGPGIPPEHLQHVFERFYQVDEATTRTQAGTGIGLSLTKELVELHGGTIAVTSDDAGTTFTVVIPLGVDAETRLAPAAPAARAVPSAVPPVTGEHDSGGAADDHGAGAHDEQDREDVPTVLVVDDSADLRQYIRTHLEPEYRVIEGGDGAVGVALARQHVPDVVISDVMMPGTDGLELVRALRASRETDFLPIVLLTAQAEDEQRIAGLERGADDYLVKPFEMRELLARVRNLIESRRRLRERLGAPTPAEPAPVAVAGLIPGDEAFVERIRSAIRARLSDPEFGVAELADAVNQDRSHLFRRVRELFGESPSDLIRRTRLEHAARLLDGADTNVATVAYAAGFNSVAGFYRAFQTAFGVTPAAYRDRMNRA